jgi:hypothetical protein
MRCGQAGRRHAGWVTARTVRRVLSIGAALVFSGSVCAATLWVGPAYSLKRPSDAARVAKAGDEVLIEAGTYSGDVAVWTQGRLRIASVGGPVVLDAAGRHAEGKAIWVMRGGDFEVEGIEFRGARVPDRNGAGIRFEATRLVVRNCIFRDNQNGILTSNNAEARLHIFDSEFIEAPRDTNGFHHLLYVGKLAELRVSGSRFHNGYNGHLLKSRAASNDLRYNLFVDGPQGHASYEVEFPNGGKVVMIGNVIGEGALTGNPYLLSYGIEGASWPENVLLLSHNTFLSNAKAGGVFVRVADERHFKAPIAAHLINNLYVLPGWTSRGPIHATSGNRVAFPGMLGDPDTLDFGLSSGSVLRGLVERASAVGGEALVPMFEFDLPRGTRPLDTPERWAPGAFQTPSAR